MKQTIYFIPILFFGCHTSSDSIFYKNAEVRENAECSNFEKRDNNMGVNNMMNADLKWTYYYKEKTDFELSRKYALADLIVADKFGTRGQYSDSSSRFGDWFIMRYNAMESEYSVFDEDQPKRTVFLVDMAKKKLIDREDWGGATPLYLLLINAPLDDSLARRLTSLTSLIAFGHERYVDADEDNSWGPTLYQSDSGTIVLEYNVVLSGNSDSSAHCKLTIDDKSVEFQVD